MLHNHNFYGIILYLLYSFVNPIVSAPIVSVTALDANPAVGKSFSMKCTVTVAKGIIIGSVSITWIFNGTEIREDKYNLTDSTEYNIMSWHNITKLQTKHNNTVYYCKATINTTFMEVPVDGIGNITINSISLGKYLITMDICSYVQSDLTTIIFISS